MRPYSRLLLLGISSLGIFSLLSFSHTAYATLNCTYGIDPAGGSVGDGCTATVSCVDTTGATEPTTSSCTGEFANTGTYVMCVYSSSNCTSAGVVDQPTRDLDNYTPTFSNPLSGGFVFTSIKNAIASGLASIISL